MGRGCGGEAVELWPWRQGRRAMALEAVGPWPWRRGRRALAVAVGGEAVGTWPWRRNRRAVALETRTLSFSYGRGRRDRWVYARGRRSRRALAVAVEAKPLERGHEGEAVVPWPWERGCRAVTLEARQSGRGR